VLGGRVAKIGRLSFETKPLCPDGLWTFDIEHYGNSVKLEFNFGQTSTWLNGDNSALAVGLLNPVLAGTGQESWSLGGSGPVIQQGDVTLWRSAEGVCGVGVAQVQDNNLQGASFSLYQQILALCQDFVIHRFWNFVPHINKPVGELDRYMCFCAGRAEAFESQLDPIFGHKLPPASAVGTDGDELWVIFLAGPAAINTVENPLQVPAYRYPKQYGPRAPSFARGGLVLDSQALYISGTASIRSSESKYVGDAAAQTELALENLQAVAESAKMPGACAADDSCQRTVRVYVREPRSWPEIAPIIERQLLQGAAQYNVIQAPICRPELLVEIECFASLGYPNLLNERGGQ
jgi:chorismate lyase / 3-hydroxybenzoate synthase